MASNAVNRHKIQLFLDLINSGKYVVADGKIKNAKTGKEIGSIRRQDNRFTVSAILDGKAYTALKSTIMWAYYHGEPQPVGTFIVHKNNNHEDFSKENLICTLTSDYYLNRVANGLTPIAGNRKLSEEEVVACRERYRRRLGSFGSLAKEHNVSKITMRAAIIGETFKNVPNPCPAYATNHFRKERTVAAPKPVKEKAPKPVKEKAPKPVKEKINKQELPRVHHAGNKPKKVVDVPLEDDGKVHRILSISQLRKKLLNR